MHENRFRLKVSDDGKKALIKLANGDMRKVLNVLQSTWMAYKDVTEETVYSCVGHPTPNDIKTIINWLMSIESFQECYESKKSITSKMFHYLIGMIFLKTEIQDLKTNKGLALEDILREVHLFVMRSK